VTRELPSKEDYTQWRGNPITELVMARIQERIRNLEQLLGAQAGLDSLEDRRMAGMIVAYKTLLEMDYSEAVDE